jgi:hypothetical protein
MLNIKNIEITQKALERLRREFARTKPRAGEERTFVFVSSYTNKDGTPLKGFSPGYMVGTLPSVHFTAPAWALAVLPYGLSLYFIPKFRWSVRDRYIIEPVDGDYALFSIGPKS